MAYQRENNDIEAIKLKIKETEADINFIGNRIAEMEEPKNRITEEYEKEKSTFEEFKRQYAEQSTYGVYFLVISFIAFVVVTYKVLNHSLVSFMFLPAAGLFIAGVIGKVIGDRKFQRMKKEMGDKEMSFAEAKEKYDIFMEGYNADVAALEQKHFEWEMIENNRIEARKDAWIAEQKRKAARV